MVEHILAALAGLRIDNCLIEIDGPELPGLDGSALGFVYHLGEAGVQHQPESRALWTVEKPISLEKDGATLTLHPLAHPQIKISYFLDFGPYSQPPQQRITVTLTPETFAYELANSRTFLREKEAKELRSQGIGKKVGIADLVIFGDKGPIQNPLRFADEPARHKILDLVGDLSLSGTEICGHVVAYKSGHPLNIALAREIKKRLAHAPHIFAA
jgi:UDP-3-O-acyl-N-acetylglucosamine deacetylase